MRVTGNRTLGIWRLTRNRYGRRFYDALAERGIRVSKLVRYGRTCRERPSVRSPAGVDVSIHGADEQAVETFTEPETDDRIVVARMDGDVVGYCFLSNDREVYVDALESWRSFDGAYVWRVFVDPSHRERGIATTIVARAVRAAADLDADSVLALVAVDNHPSKRLFESLGFEAEETLSFYRFLSWRHRTAHPVAD